MFSPTEAQKIRAQAKAIRDAETLINKDLHKQILSAWKVLRPKMWAELQRQELANDLALVAQAAMWEASDRYEKAGMPPTDANEQAERECLLMEPETTDE